MRALTYHRIGHAEKDPFCVSTEDFEQQIALIASQKRAVSLNQVEDYVAGHTELPPCACLVTIDDGMISTLTKAAPILEKYRVPAVAFVSSKLIGFDLPGLEERYMNWDELKALSASGLITVGSHAHTHRSMGELSEAEVETEVVTSRKMLSDALQFDVRSFAYPFGTVTDFSHTTDSILRASGYNIAFSSLHGSIKVGMDLVSLPRVKIEGGESCKMFIDISNGAMDAWRHIDDRFWRVQRDRREIS